MGSLGIAQDRHPDGFERRISRRRFGRTEAHAVQTSGSRKRRLLAGTDPRSTVIPRRADAPGAGKAPAVGAEGEHEAAVVVGGSAHPTPGQGFAGEPSSHLALATAEVGASDFGADL